MLASIQLPPPPPALPLYIVSGLCILLGAALMLWGRSSGKVVLTLAAAGIGAACAPTISRLTNFPYLWVVGIAAAVTAGLIMFLLARLVWALLLSGLVGAGALVIVQWPGIGKLASPPDWTCCNLNSFGEWVWAVGQYYVLWVWTLWQNSMMPLLLMVALPMFVFLLAALLLPKAASILASSLVGSGAIVVGLAGLVWAVKPQWFPLVVEQLKILGVVAAVLALLGLVLQTRGEFQSIAKAKAKEKEAENKKQEAGGAADSKQAKK